MSGPVDDALDLIAAALRQDENVRGGNAGPLAALATLRDELQRLREERDAAQRDFKWQTERLIGWKMRHDAAEARCARLQQALQEMERSALKAAQLLPMTVSTSVEADHRGDHASWAGWLLRHKVLPVAREALAGLDTPADSQPEDGTAEAALADMRRALEQYADEMIGDGWEGEPDSYVAECAAKIRALAAADGTPKDTA